jgi:hypothetical protein
MLTFPTTTKKKKYNTKKLEEEFNNGSLFCADNGSVMITQ